MHIEIGILNQGEKEKRKKRRKKRWKDERYITQRRETKETERELSFTTP